MDNKPLVSILLPTYNGATFIAEAIQSVLSQTYQNWELLIIDDGSRDNTVRIVETYCSKDSRIKLIKNESNIGLQKTLNKGLRLAEGVYIARIDDDDVWSLQTKLAEQVAFLEAHQDHVLVGTGMHAVTEDGRKLYDLLPPETDEKIRKRLLFRTSFIHPSVCLRRDSVLACGGYSEDPSVKHMEDHDLWLKLGLQGKLHNLQFFATTIRLRKGSITGTHVKDQLKRTIDLIKKYQTAYPGYRRALCFAYIRLLIRMFIQPTR